MSPDTDWNKLRPVAMWRDWLVKSEAQWSESMSHPRETDNIPFPGGVFRQMVNDFLRGNKLVKGEWLIGGKMVDVARITVPLLHLLAQDDRITPYASSRDLVTLVGSRDRQEVIVRGGHVGLVAGRGAQTRMWPVLEAWLAPRSV